MLGLRRFLWHQMPFALVFPNKEGVVRSDLLQQRDDACVVANKKPEILTSKNLLTAGLSVGAVKNSVYGVNLCWIRANALGQDNEKIQMACLSA